MADENDLQVRAARVADFDGRPTWHAQYLAADARWLTVHNHQGQPINYMGVAYAEAAARFVGAAQRLVDRQRMIRAQQEDRAHG